jgi:hypothetical protein
MKIFNRRIGLFTLMGWAGGLSAFAANVPLADVAPIAKRRLPVEMAQRLATVSPPAPLSPDVVFPFNPVAFGQPDPEEQRAIDQALALQQALTETPAGGTAGGSARGATDREQLAAIASKILPKGSVLVGKNREPNLIIGNKFYKIGSKFTVSYSGVDYVLELTAIDNTTFTLRLNGEAITRPIKPAAKTSP